jgi:hypothetical protein
MGCHTTHGIGQICTSLSKQLFYTMHILRYLLIAASLLLASCGTTTESESEHSHDGEAHSHGADSSHSHDHPPVQEEFSVASDSIQSNGDTTGAKPKKGTHTHADGQQHEDH